MILNNEEVFFVDIEDNKSMVYIPLRSFLGVIKSDDKVKLINTESLDSKVFFEYISERGLVDIKQIHTAVSTSKPSLAIALTDDCNIGCLYCHHSAGEMGRYKSIDKNLAKKAITNHFDQNQASKEIRITFMGGGEPTANFPLMKDLVEYATSIAHNSGKTCKFRMATNGCFGKDIADYIILNFDEISLSFDGPEHIQNLQRPTKNGAPTYAAVFNTAKYLYNSGFSFAFRSTISDYSIDHIEEIIDFFSFEFPGKSLGLEPLNPYGRATRQETVSAPNRARFAKRMIDAHEYSKNKNIKILSACLGKFETLRTIFCGAVGIPNYTILTDGTITCCTRDNVPEQFNYGKIDNTTGELILDADKIEKVKQMNVFNFEECQDCFCKYHCAGDCPDLRLSGLVDCDSNRLLGRYFLEQKLNKKGGE